MKIVLQRRSEAIIPTASMADIAFLLIIFFMVTTVHDVDRTNVALPSSFVQTENEKGSAVVVVHKDRNGMIVYKFSDGAEQSTEVPSPREIYLEATRITAQESDRQFIIKADGDLRYELVDEVLDNLRQAGASRLLLLTQPTRTEG